MNLLARFLYWYSGGLPCRLIPLPNGPYLERYYLGFWWGQYRYLHRLIRNDSERHLHDHPWWLSTSWVLTGFYWEEKAIRHNEYVLSGGIRKVRWFNKITRNHVHRIIQVRPETWTLFSHGPWAFEWGFYDTQPGEWPVKIISSYRRFKSAPAYSSGSQWWRDAPIGRLSSREPFGG